MPSTLRLALKNSAAYGCGRYRVTAVMYEFVAERAARIPPTNPWWVRIETAYCELMRELGLEIPEVPPLALPPPVHATIVRF